MKTIEVTNFHEEMANNEEIDNLKRNCLAQISILDEQIIESAERCISRDKTPGNMEECEALYETTCEIENEIKDINFKLKRLIIDGNELQKEVSEAVNMNLKAKKVRIKLKNFLEQKFEAPTAATNVYKPRVKLPRITLKKFSGDPLEWKSFQETYEAPIENCKDLSDIS